MAFPYRRNFSVRVVLPASGCEMIAKVRRRAISWAGVDMEGATESRKRPEGKPFLNSLPDWFRKFLHYGVPVARVTEVSGWAGKRELAKLYASQPIYLSHPSPCFSLRSSFCFP